MTKGNIILDPHHLVVAVAFQIENIIAVGGAPVMHDSLHPWLVDGSISRNSVKWPELRRVQPWETVPGW